MARIGWLNQQNSWVVSSWAFRQLLEDVLAQYPDDPELTSEFQAASRVKCLFIDGFHPELTTRVTHAIRETASAIASGRIQTQLVHKPYGTAEIIAEYRQSLEALLGVVGALPDFAP